MQGRKRRNFFKYSTKGRVFDRFYAAGHPFVDHSLAGAGVVLIAAGMARVLWWPTLLRKQSVGLIIFFQIVLVSAL